MTSAALNAMTEGVKAVETAATAITGKHQASTLPMQCLRDGVQRTAMQKDGGVSAGHITFTLHRSGAASEHLGKTHFGHYIPYILFSILQQMASGFKLIYELGYIPS